MVKMANIFSLTSMPSATTVLSTYSTFAASAILVRTVLSEIQTTVTQIIPPKIQEKILSKIGGLLGNPSSQITIIFDDYDGYVVNQMYEACKIFLRTKIPPSVQKLKVFQDPEGKNLSITIAEGETAIDIFEGIQVKWEMVCTKKQSMEGVDYEARSMELSFPKKNMERILSSYLPYVVERSKAFIEENKVLKLYSYGGSWESTNLHHPSTFETLAMDSKLKQDLINDLDRFVKRKKYYKRVGRAWKRGYLLYGPPGTGKSSLVAAMANYLKFDIYDLELTSLRCNSEFRRLLVSTTNQSILVIEDIDCSSELQSQQPGGHNPNNSQLQLTLSGLLNFIDGLWSSCGDERIIVLTTNHKERLDPALLRPGRMDMHIHMSYCTPCGFKTLASNYLGIRDHRLFPEIEKLIVEVEVTPAAIAEELMKSEEADFALGRLVEFLTRVKTARNEATDGEDKEANKKGNESPVVDQSKKKAKRNKPTARNQKRKAMSLLSR
ncbi:hypothetical protein PVL29_001312 [Vitis rotundifolia]|uniref:AAA+ ATPase domain-containing protein n=4 Tax=Vitis rotundifolia TaxID=103349 RepID=A0AA39ALD0_VITRO|nr:hypothetical protein PVL29_001312 [Vitis rotundifolia]